MLLSEVQDELTDDGEGSVAPAALLVPPVHVHLVLHQRQLAVQLFLRRALWALFTSQVGLGVLCFPVHLQDPDGGEHFATVKALESLHLVDTLGVVHSDMLVKQLLSAGFEYA